MNRITRYCNGLIEAAWLSALIVTPLMMSLSGSVANMIKIALLRSIIMVGLSAWGIAWISGLSWGAGQSQSGQKPGNGEPNWRMRAISFLRQPLVMPVLALVFVYLISTLFSISPSVSILGSYARMDGITTFTSYILLFVLIATHLRQRVQLDRLMAVIAAVSFAVDIYAILQHYGLDPMPWTVAEVTIRASSTIGYPIFAAAFLNLTFFALLGRLILAFQAYRHERRLMSGDLARIILYGMVAVLNLVAIWFTASRGPLLGLLAGASIFVFLLSIYWKNKPLQAAFLILGVIFLIVVGMIFAPGNPLTTTGSLTSQALGRLAQPLEGDTSRTRVLIWEGVSKIVFSHAPLVFPDKTQDQWNAIRPLIGYGPETLSLVFSGNYTPEMYAIEKRYVKYDRAHNEFWNTAAFLGGLGVLAEYGLFLAIFYFGLTWLGLLVSRFEQRLYWGLSLVGGVIGAVVCILLGGTAFLGLGIPLGLLAGLVGILFLRIFRDLPKSSAGLKEWQSITLICIFSALVSHYVEILFGISMVVSNQLMWSYLAIMLVIGRSLGSEAVFADVLVEKRESAVSKKSRVVQPAKGGWQDAFLQIMRSTGSLTLMMVTLGSGFIVIFQAGDSVTATLINAFTSVASPMKHTSYGVLGLFISTLLFSGILFHLEFGNNAGKTQTWINLPVSVGLTLVCSLFFFAVRANELVQLHDAKIMADTALLTAGNLNLATSYFGFLFFFCLVWAFALQPGQVAGGLLAKVRWPAILAGLFLSFGFIFISAFLNLRPVQADMLMILVRTENAANRYDSALTVYRNVLKLMPEETFYLINAEKVYKDVINTNQDAGKKEQLFQEGLATIQKAFELEPLYVDVSMALARFYRLGGEISSDPAQKNLRFNKANSYFASGLAASPARVDYWLDWADFLAASGDLQGAYARVNDALAMDPKSDQAYQFLGNLAVYQASTQVDAVASTIFYMKAVQAFQTQADLITARGDKPSKALLAVAQVFEKMEQFSNARENYLRAATLGIGENEWLVYKKLADLSARLNDVSARRDYLQKAHDLAPQDQKPALQEELDGLPLP